MPQRITFDHPGDHRQVEMLAWSDSDLDAMAQISEEDRHRAQSYWRTILPRRFRTLLDAISTVRAVR